MTSGGTDTPISDSREADKNTESRRQIITTTTTVSKIIQEQEY